MSFQVGELFARLGLETSQFDTGLAQSEGSLSTMSGTFAKFGLAAGAAMAAAGVAVVGLAVNFSSDLQKSLNGVQASTGVADESMAEMKETMTAIYNDNFGESFEEIGASMATINQQTGLSGEALKKTTEGALALKDTFGMEVTDSIRGANQLMKQFGLDGTESYNLIAQGAQWGLDANGDLLDTLNEYSGTFAAQGFSAEEMFNMLSNGAASGVRDTDLLADAMKEFGIRSKDGSKASSEGFKALGLDSEAMTKAFATGGTAGREAFDKVTKALFEMKDPVAQNAAGVALFGTQWEDLGVKGVQALVNTEGEIGKNVDALGKINAVKYNTFGEAMTGIKRQLEVGILLPLGDSILPKLNEFGNFLQQNLPAVIETAKGFIAGIGNEITYLGDHMDVIIPILTGVVAGIVAFQVITTVSSLMKSFQLATEGVTIAQWALNLAMSANPIALVAIAIGLLVAAGVALWMNWDTIKVKVGELWTTITAAFENIKTSIITKISEWWTALSTWFTTTKEGIVGKLSEWWISIGSWYDDSKSSIVTKLSEWWTSIGTWYTTTKDSIVAKLSEWWTSIGKWHDESKDNIIVKLADWLLSIMKWYLDTGIAIVNKLAGWWTSLSQWYDDTKTNVVAKLAGWWASIKLWYDNTKTSIIGKLAEWWASLETWYNNTKASVVLKLGEWWASIETWYNNTKTSIIAKLAEWWSSLETWYNDTKANVVTKLADWLLSIMKWYLDTGIAIVNKLAGWWTSLSQWYDDTKTNVVAKLAGWWASIKLWYDNTKTSIIGKLAEWWASLETWYNNTKASVVLKLGEWWASIETWYNNTKTSIIAKLAEWWSSLETWYNDTKANVVTKLGEWWASMSQWYDDTRESMKTKWDEIKESISLKLGELHTAAMEKFNTLSEAIGTVWTGIKSTIETTINSIIGTINGFINHVNSIKIHIPVVTIPLVGTFGGGTISMPQIPNIPLLKFHDGGWVGESGEIPAILQEGEFVLSRQMLRTLSQQQGSTNNSNTTDNSRKIEQTVIINSPAAMNPSEVARQSKNALRELALNF